MVTFVWVQMGLWGAWELVEEEEVEEEEVEEEVLQPLAHASLDDL